MEAPATYPENAIPLLAEDGSVAYFMVETKEPGHAGYSFTGKAYYVMSWHDEAGTQPFEFEEIARIYLKSDGCAHVGLGDPGLNLNWSHVCGPERMEATLSMLRWMWTTAQSRIEHYDQDELMAAKPN